MSVISDRHSIIPFVSGETKPMHKQRLAKVGYKTTKKQAAKFKSVAVSVPFVQADDIQASYQKLLPHIGAMIENAQDGLLGHCMRGADGKLDTVSDADISVEACVQFLNADREGGRLTKAALEGWFDDNCADMLFVAIAEKCGFGGVDTDPTEAQAVQLNKSVDIYRKLITSMSGGATVFTPGEIKGVRKMFETLMIQDEVEKKLIARLDKMEEKKEEIDLANLL